MLRDVFYYGAKPNAHPREKFAKDLDDARKQCVTEHFWIINEYCDYRNFDWDFDFDYLPDEDVWTQDHNNVWPSNHQKDSGTWLCPKEFSDVIVYRNDVNPIQRYSNKDNWILLDKIDESQFDFSWHPDPTDPPYIYRWGCKYFPVQVQHVLEYKVPEASQVKYMDTVINLLPEQDKWTTLKDIDKTSFDFSWRPDPREPAFIYVFGNQFYDGIKMPTVEYHCDGATERKYISDIKAKLSPNKSAFQHLEDSYLKDYSWLPDPDSPPYIYAWGNQWNKPEDKISVQYVMPGATEYKYMQERAIRNTCMDNWIVPENVDVTGFDFSWEPSPAEPPFIYQFGTQWQKDGGPKYVVNNATEIKYVSTQKVKALPSTKNWTVPSNIDVTGFDFSWHPDSISPPYIYVFSTQWALTGGPVYTVEGATEKKYVEYPSAVALPIKTNWHVPDDIDIESFDFSWHPFSEDDPCVYQIGTQWQKTGGPKYIVPGTDESSPVKYIDRRIIKSKKLSNKSKFKINYPIIEEEFDWSWHPDETEDPYIYVFGNQHYNAEKMSTIEYQVEGATQYKFINDIKAKLAPSKNNWVINIPIVESKWDFTWTPDPDESPYIYVWGNEYIPGEKIPTISYVTPGATDYKYMGNYVDVEPEWDKWKINIPVDKTKFDFKWRPSPDEPPYIYVFGNQWNKAEIESTVEYHAEGATERKYVSDVVAHVLPNMSHWKLNYQIDKTTFDFSWRPDPGSPPYIYAFGGNLYPVEEMAVVEYHVQEATDYKYVHGITSTLIEDKSKWIIPKNVDVSDFDFSWHPNPKDPPFIYCVGTQWQKTGGPKYIVEGATDIKYLEDKKVKALPSMVNWMLPPNLDVTDFDFSWHPDDTEPPYTYQFGTQWALTGGPKYMMAEATETKYMEHPVAKALPDRTNWVIPENIDSEEFDYSWHPYIEDQPYIYQFGTQHQKTGGHRYITPGADESSSIKYIDRRILKSKALSSKKEFVVLNNFEIVDFDFSWHLDDTEEPYIYVFGNQHWPAEKMPTMEYRVEGATQYKYINTVKATIGPTKNNWHTLIPIDDSKWDYSWVPDPHEPPYIYVWGNQWNSAEVESTIEYRVPGATDKKYMSDKIAQVLPNRLNWNITEPIVEDKFDFSWRPNPYEEPYIYTFGNNLYSPEEMPTVEYKVPEAKQRKYIKDISAILAPDKRNWIIPNDTDVSNFDFSWKPNPTAPAFIYEFGTQWQKTHGPKYVVKNATETKYVDLQKVTRLANKENWVIPNNIDEDSFDFSWHPDATEPPYIYQFGTQWQKTGGPRYVSPGSDESTPVKYVDSNIMKAKAKSNKTKFAILNNYKIKEFDFSWHPDDTENPYIYIFGNNQYPGEIMPTIEYAMQGAKEIKYVPDSVLAATLDIDYTNWLIPDNIDKSKFDFSWKPNPKDPPYIYEFGTQWNDRGGPKYVVGDATDYKYVDTQKATLLPNKSKWELTDTVDATSFDFSWVPHPDDPPYIYVFGTQWQKTGGPKYIVEGATELKYIDTQILKGIRVSSIANWEFDSNEIDVNSFDFSWHPDDTEEPFIYQFGTQWQKTGGPRYISPGANRNSPVKYVDRNILKARRLPNKNKFKVLGGAKVKNFDWSWHPDDTSPPYSYFFGNQWYSAEEMPTIEYKVEGATEVTFIDAIKAELGPNMNNWTIPKGIDVNKFDFSWIPFPDAKPYIYQFGTSSNPKDGPVYTTPGALETINVPRVEKKIEEEVAEEVNITEEKPNSLDLTDDNPTKELYDIFYVDRGNKESIERFELLKGKYGNRIQKTRYLNSWVDTINRCINRSTTELCWILNSELDYSEFEFEFYPNPWQMKMVHVFGTQWSHWGTTFLVNRGNFSNDTKYIKIIEHLSNLNFVRDRKAIATSCLYDIVLIDHGNKETANIEQLLKNKIPYRNISVVKFKDSYLSTLKQYVKTLPDKKENYIWIVSSVCNYSNFDFSYICDPFAKDQLHVFPSNNQKFGDTFLIDVDKTKTLIDDLETLEQYKKVNYNNHQRVPRLSPPIVVTGDTHVDIVNHEFDFPYCVAVTNDNEDIKVIDAEPISLWSIEKRNILLTSNGGTRIIVPKDVKNYVKEQMYDYPYIKTANRLVDSHPLDIVFLSNGETCADKNYEHLLKITHGLKNRVIRVDGINGRVEAYHAALEASQTPWAFTVFAKLKVSAKFDWNWQPDRLQMPKHYIFHAKNPVNGLEYGHQGMIAYNKKLTLNNKGFGLDFTLDDPHETVEILSGVATYNTDEFSTWRTAFREAIKLRVDNSDLAKSRLEMWLSDGTGDFCEYSKKGAQDALDYYNEVRGDPDQLKLSYEWKWLKQKYKKVNKG